MSQPHSSTEQFLATTVPVAAKWLTECATKHISCGKRARHSTVFCTDNNLLISDLRGEGLVATRLLSFPLSPSREEDDVVRLALSESLSADTQYTALSHRWGTNETFCTTRANLGGLVQTGIPTSKLPATFRDAVHVARGLGFSHLWIDSFCIVQDDKDDWKAEARRMAIIYDNAACTIVAADGLDSSAGLFMRDPKLAAAGVLDTRAWVCQERMISPRSLIFSGGSVAWECRECDATLESPGLVVRGVNGAEETPAHPKDIFAFFRDFRLPPPIPESESEAEEWQTDEDGDGEDDESYEDGLEDGTEADEEGNDNEETDDEEGDDTDADRTSGDDEDNARMVESRSLNDAKEWKIVFVDNRSYRPGIKSDEDKSEEHAEANEEEGNNEEEDEIIDADEMVDDDGDDTRMVESGPSNGPESSEITSVNDRSYDSDGYPAYQGGLPGHAANLSVFLEGQRSSKAYRMHPDGPNEDGSDPFGDFVVIVTDLNRPREVYTPFLKTWWQFLSNYSSLSLTYDSDKFLAINGVTTVAQRWSHLRSSFGLFWHFFETEMLWYVDPKGPSGARQESWLVPTWSWASTRNGRVVNDMYRRSPMSPSMLIKPEFKMPMGTAFDQPLPFAAWMARRYHTIEMKGDLRKGTVTAVREDGGNIKYAVTLDKLASFSDEEKYAFRPDCAEEFPVGETVKVLYMVWYHYDAFRCEMGEHIDVGLVFKQMNGETEITMYDEDVPKEWTSEQRLLTRLGYMETTYPAESMRDMGDVMAELTWYFVRVA